MALEGGHWTAVEHSSSILMFIRRYSQRKNSRLMTSQNRKSVLQGIMYLDFIGNADLDEMRHVGRTGVFCSGC